jgi:hypothetical protein
MSYSLRLHKNKSDTAEHQNLHKCVSCRILLLRCVSSITVYFKGGTGKNVKCNVFFKRQEFLACENMQTF